MELTSIDKKLDCSTSQYVNLLLEEVDNQEKVNITPGNKVTVAEALDIKGEKKKIVLIKGNPGMGKSILAINVCKCWAKGSLLQNMTQ